MTYARRSQALKTFIVLSRYKVNIGANCDYSKCIAIWWLIVPEGGLWFQPDGAEAGSPGLTGGPVQQAPATGATGE